MIFIHDVLILMSLSLGRLIQELALLTVAPECRVTSP